MRPCHFFFACAELEECRAFELLRGQGDRVNYLMTKQVRQLTTDLCAWAHCKAQTWLRFMGVACPVRLLQCQVSWHEAAYMPEFFANQAALILISRPIRGLLNTWLPQQVPFAYLPEEHLAALKCTCILHSHCKQAYPSPISLPHIHPTPASHYIAPLSHSQAKIVAMTCTHAALKRREFIELAFQYDNLLMEEAGQILEIETFIPMLLQVRAQLTVGCKATISAVL